MDHSKLQPTAASLESEWTPRTVRELIDRMAHTRGDEPFLISPETGRVLTFAALRRQSRAISAQLRQAGLTVGDKVAFLLDNGLFTAQLFLGAMYGGFVSVPLNIRAGVAQLTSTLEHCDAKVVFVEEQYKCLLEVALAGIKTSISVVCTDIDRFATDFNESSEDEIFAMPAPENVALLMYTSGSVGRPKAAIHSHRTLLAHGRNSRHSHQLTSADRSLLVLPIYHINAECVTLMPTLVAGGSVVVPHHFEVSKYWDLLEEYRCTWSAIVPTIVSQLLDWKDPRANQRESAFRRIRFIRSSSAPLSPSLQREFLDKFDLRLIQAMGSSECGNIFANPQAPGENKIGTPGPAWGFETRIVDSDGNDVARGESGEVRLRGPAVMQGYYKDPEGTALVLDSDGWLWTGDLGYQDADGYFFIVGRSKELIIKAGMNIAPRQIDEVLEAYPAVLEAAVVGLPDRHVGEDLVAFVVLRSGMVGDEREMLSFCEKRLGHFKTPTRIHFVVDLPKGPSGKVQRLRLLDDAERLRTAGQLNYGHFGHAANLTTTSNIEQTITECWAAVLKQATVDANSNFFSLGGHSLMAIQCLSRMREKLPIVLSLSDFFENATVAELAAIVRQRLSTIAPTAANTVADNSSHVSEHDVPAREAQSIPRRRVLSPYPLSPAQKGIWFFRELAPDVPLYNESEAVRLLGELNVDGLERALQAIVARHEVLRTTFQLIDEEPIGVVDENQPLQIKQMNLSDLPPEKRAAELERLLLDERRRPFDLESGPGFRATLFRMGPHENVFLVVMHHLICDSWSMGVLWRELSAFYQAFSRGTSIELPPLPLQYGDYAVWQQQLSNDATSSEDTAYWKDNLRGASGLLELPADRHRLSVQSYRGARQHFRLNADLAQSLRNCSRREKTSLFMLFAAAFNVLLYRYSGSEDILLGIPLGDRDWQELQSVMGFLIHTCVIRTKLSANTTFRELLVLTQKALLDLYSHRSLPFDQVVNILGPKRSLAYSPLFQVMIIWRDREHHLSLVGLDGLVAEPLLADNKTSKFDLTLFVTDTGDDIWLEAEYSTDLFDDDRIARMFRHYQTLLEAVSADGNQPVSRLKLLSPEERTYLVEDCNATHAEYPRDLCVHQLVEEQVLRTPDAIAAVYEDQQLTYSELNSRAEHLAARLRHLGVRPGVLAAVYVERSLEMLIALLGVLKAGGAYVPMDPSYPPQRLAFVLEDTKAPLLLTQQHLASNLTTSATQVVYLDDAQDPITRHNGSAPCASTSISSEDLAYVIYTSGSTGLPKGVEIRHRAVINLLNSMRKKPGLDSNDTLLSVTTLSFDITGLELFLPLCVGAKLVIVSREATTDGDLLLRRIVSSGASVMQATPVTFRLLIEAGWDGWPKLKILCGGEALPTELAKQLLERSASVWNMYGPTETTIWSSTLKLVAAEETIPIGPPIDNTRFYVLDPREELTPIGIPGELYIGGTGLARGYFGKPELTAEKFIRDKFSDNSSSRLYRTGDLVQRRCDGTFTFLGRLDHQVKFHGYRVELGEIEAALARYPGVREVVVKLRHDTPGEKRLVAYVITDHQAFTAAMVREYLRDKLPNYMLPSATVNLNAMPLTPNGKIDRGALPAPEIGLLDSAVFYVAPRNPIEDVLTDIWRKILDLKQIGVNDNFFDLGGHSLLAIRMTSEVERTFNHRLPLPTFFRDPTIAEIARALVSDDKLKEPRLIPLEPGTSNGTLFFIDAGIGQCRLARLLSGPASFATIVPYPLGSFQREGGHMANWPSLEALAKEHVALIRTRRTSGPCMILGHSFGGVLAFEVAHQLQREGIAVELLILLDVWTKTPTWWRLRWQRLKRRGVSYLWSILRGKSSRARTTVEAWNIPSASSTWIGNADLGQVPLTIVRNARETYRFHPLDCQAVLYHSQDDPYVNDLRAIDEKMGWNGLFTRGIEIVETPGDHLSLLQDPHLQILASRIKDRLR